MRSATIIFPTGRGRGRSRAGSARSACGYNKSRVSVSLPSPLDHLGSRRFSFYPPIRGVRHNQWSFRRAAANEILVVNTKTLEELSIPRHFIGEISTVGEPVVIVGLVKELELKAEMVVPHIRRVIEMPRAVNDSPRPALRRAQPAEIVGIRVEPDQSSGWRSRWLLGSIAAALLACVAVLSLSPRVEPPFTARDNYDSIVARLGPPSHDQTQTTNGKQYRHLAYPRRGFTVLLVDGHYAGAVDSAGRVIHAVRR